MFWVFFTIQGWKSRFNSQYYENWQYSPWTVKSIWKANISLKTHTFIFLTHSNSNSLWSVLALLYWEFVLFSDSLTEGMRREKKAGCDPDFSQLQITSHKIKASPDKQSVSDSLGPISASTSKNPMNEYCRPPSLACHSKAKSSTEVKLYPFSPTYIFNPKIECSAVSKTGSYLLSNAQQICSTL